MLLSNSQLTYKGIRPMHRLGDIARVLALHNPFLALTRAHPAPPGLKSMPPLPLPGNAQAGRNMIMGSFDFAGQTIERENLGWLPSDASAGWLEALHGFSWLRDLRAVGGERARRMAREMVTGWISAFSQPHDVAWRLDILGARLTSWIGFYDFFCASADDDFRAAYFSSLIQQAKYLNKIVPKNMEGLSLLRAYKGLAWAGFALEGGEEWLERALRGLFMEAEKQILPDGGHVSRNPQAALEWLQCLIEVRAGLAASNIPVPGELAQIIERVASAVRFFRHPDGAFAQFNGANADNGRLCDAVLIQAAARASLPSILADSGYHRLQQGRASLILDAGAPIVCAARESAHAGLLSFEYSFGRERIFVNCGSAASKPLRWQRVLRSTLAHCALAIDNRNACSLDGNNLMLNRPLVRAQREKGNSAIFIEATHDGYKKRFGIIHQRRLSLENNGEVLSGEDTLTGSGTVAADFAVRFHLHPDIDALFEDEEIVLRARSGIVWRFAAEGARLSLEESVYAGTAGVPSPSKQIVLYGRTAAAPSVVRWMMVKQAF